MLLLHALSWLEMIMCHPINNQTDTPIQKITIQPAPPTVEPHPLNSNTTHVSPARGRKIENDPPPRIINVLKKPSKKPVTSTHPKKYGSNSNVTDKNPIYFTRAKVNGSFRHSSGRTRDAKQLWHAFRIRSDPLSI